MQRVFIKQGNVIAIVFFIHQLAAQLWVGGQVAVSTNIKAVSGLFVVIGKVARGVPVGRARIGIKAQLQEVCPGLSTGPDAAVFTREVIIKEDVSTEHPVFKVKHPDAQTKVTGVAAVRRTIAELGKEELLLVVIQWQQEVQRAVVPVTVVINVQLHLSRAELAQPVLG